MKKLKLNLENVGEILTRDQLKKILGGSEGGAAPDSPSGGSSTATYKCCWTGTSNCSTCVSCNSNCTCVPGASLEQC